MKVWNEDTMRLQSTRKRAKRGRHAGTHATPTCLLFPPSHLHSDLHKIGSCTFWMAIPVKRKGSNRARFRGVGDLQGRRQLLARIGECKWPNYFLVSVFTYLGSCWIYLTRFHILDLPSTRISPETISYTSDQARRPLDVTRKHDARLRVSHIQRPGCTWLARGLGW